MFFYIIPLIKVNYSNEIHNFLNKKSSQEQIKKFIKNKNIYKEDKKKIFQ